MGQRGVSLLVHGLSRHGTIPWRLLGTVHLHGPRPKRRQRQALLGWLLCRHPRNPLPCPLPAGPWAEDIPAPSPPPSLHPVPAKTSPPPSLKASMVLAAATEEASSALSDLFALGGPRTSSRHPKPGARCQPLLCRGDLGGGSMGAGKAIVSLDRRGLAGAPAPPPSPCPLPALARHSLGTSGHLPRPSTGAPWQDTGWLQGQPQAAKPPQCPRLPKC